MTRVVRGSGACGPAGVVRGKGVCGSACGSGRLRVGAGESDDGQVMLLSLGFAVLAILLVLVVAAATAVHLDRKRLLALADLAALAAADQAGERYYSGDRGPAGVPLDDADVRAAVEEYVAANPDPAARWDGVVVLDASTPDGRSAVVRLGAVTHPPLVTWVLAPWSDGIALEGEATARAS